MDRVRLVVDTYGVDSVLHCDTDSVIYLGEPIGGYGKELGMWDLESRPDEIYEGGFKRYIEVFNGFDGQTILEEGTEVRIPKVEPKKTVRKRLQQQQNNQ